jgi:transcriptional regulator with XRE-family HTH domain
MDELVDFGLRIKELRSNASLSQEALAAECALDRTYISGIERGRRNPSLKNIIRIAKALNVSPSQLFEGGSNAV